MKEEAVRQAEDRLARAEEGLARLKAAESAKEMEQGWHTLIGAAGTVYSKLEQGAKGSGKSEPWFGRRKKERNDDPLLRYVHHARNSSEHSIEKIVHKTEWAVSVPISPTGWTKVGVRAGPGNTAIPFSNQAEMIVTGPEMALVSVTNRGVRYDPPTEHLGQPLVSQEPGDVGDRLIEYLREMIAEARALV